MSVETTYRCDICKGEKCNGSTVPLFGFNVGRDRIKACPVAKANYHACSGCLDNLINAGSALLLASPQLPSDKAGASPAPRRPRRATLPTGLGVDPARIAEQPPPDDAPIATTGAEPQKLASAGRAPAPPKTDSEHVNIDDALSQPWDKRLIFLHDTVEKLLPGLMFDVFKKAIELKIGLLGYKGKESKMPTEKRRELYEMVVKGEVP